MLDKIKQIMEWKDLTASQFADGMDVPRAILSHILSGRNKPSLDVVLKIASTYSEISLEWLLLGKGEMLSTLAEENTQNALPGIAPVTEVASGSINSSQVEHDAIVQKEATHSTALDSTHEKEKAVKQVMFFYADGTFEAFKPGI